MSKYVVAGATGRVGSIVAGDLLARGEQVTVLARDAAPAASWSGRGAQVAVGSLADAAFLARVLEGATGFFTLLPEDPAVPDFHGHRRRMADAIAKAVRQSRVPHVVMQSAIAASLPDRNGPAKDLHYLEGALRATGATITASRACYFQENIASAIAPAKQAGVFPSLMPSADAAFPTIATLDAGRFAARALTSPPARSESVDLFGPAYSMRQMAEKLGAALGRSLTIVDIPPAGQVAALTEAGLPPAFAEAVAELHAAFAAGIIAPNGDRSLAGVTTLDEVLPGLLWAEPRAASSTPARAK
jgi:uncharacterized protein YbjT (DUF2867 family)